MSSRVKHILLDQNVCWQIARFILTGGFITVSGAGCYWLLAQGLNINPFVAMTLVYAIFLLIAYILHSNISFKGYGSRDKIVRRSTRFLTTNLLGLAINQFFVWLLVEYAEGSHWWPIIPFIFVTPVISFLLSRSWVFR